MKFSNSIVSTPLNNLPSSLTFYQKLKFKSVDGPLKNLFSDGSFLLEINESPYARPSLKLYKENWANEISNLKSITKYISLENSILVAAPSGMWVYLIQNSENDCFHLPTNCNSVLGNFAGVSVESIDIEASIRFWNLLGFKLNSGSSEQGWVSLNNADGMSVSVMKPNSCPHLFFTPSLTFFNGKENLEIIEKIRKTSIPFSQEVTTFNDKGIVDNVLLMDPGGLGFFIFND